MHNNTPRKISTYLVPLVLLELSFLAHPIQGSWQNQRSAGQQSESSSSAQNWPQWRGNGGLAISDESGLPTHWGVNENVAWKMSPAGPGASSPIIWGKMVIITSQIGNAHFRPGNHPQLSRDDSLLVRNEIPMGGRRPQAGPDGDDVFLVVEAFSVSSGERLWQYRTAATGEFPPLHESHNLATPTPVTDGDRVYTWFGNGQILCLSLDGEPIWTRHLGTEISPFRNNWGHGSSPILYKDLLILLCDHESTSYLLALDKITGKTKWRVDRGKSHISHSTPLVISGPSGDEMVVNSSVRIDTYNPANGQFLWHAGTKRQIPIPSPVFHNGIIYMSRGYRNSDFMAIRPGGRGDVSGSHILWRNPGGASYVPSIVYYNGLLYMTNEVGVVTCADAETGQRVWRQRLGGIFFASPVAGDGKVYLISETGETYVLQSGREPEVLARNDLKERFIASPAISNHKLFLRSDTILFCIGK